MFVTTLAAFAACLAIKTAPAQEVPHNLYPTVGLVVEVEAIENVVTVEDFNGERFQFDDVDTWFVDDICAMIMDDMGTPYDVRDDEIVEYRYCGWVEQ